MPNFFSLSDQAGTNAGKERLYNAICKVMDENGLDGCSSGGQYPGWGHYGYHWITNSHNIAGMLTESASAKLASPKYIDPSQLKGDGDIVQPNYEQQTNFPSPWAGGWWRLGDIVARQYTAAYALLDTMARNKEAVLRNMTKKALNQTKRGNEGGIFAYIIPENQHDRSEVKNLIRLLLGQHLFGCVMFTGPISATCHNQSPDHSISRTVQQFSVLSASLYLLLQPVRC